jgi:molecular chaperone IbpA
MSGPRREPNPQTVALKENTMRNVDFSPLYRSTVGFDRLFGLIDSMAQADQANAYPPYNIERTGENTYRITMAVAGFDDHEMTIEAKPNLLTVTGKKADAPEADGNAFLYRGIAQRGFERRFHTADYVEVAGASLKNGLLHIDLKREIPEALKPRRIEIESVKAQGAKVIEAKAA